MDQCKHASFIHPSLSLALTHGFLFFLQLCMGLHQPDGGAGAANISCLTSPSPCLLPLLGFLSIQGLLDLFRGTLDCQANRGPEAVMAPGCVRPSPLMTPFARLWFSYLFCE